MSPLQKAQVTLSKRAPDRWTLHPMEHGTRAPSVHPPATFSPSRAPGYRGLCTSASATPRRAARSPGHILQLDAAAPGSQRRPRSPLHTRAHLTRVSAASQKPLAHAGMPHQGLSSVPGAPCTRWHASPGLCLQNTRNKKDWIREECRLPGEVRVALWAHTLASVPYGSHGWHFFFPGIIKC